MVGLVSTAIISSAMKASRTGVATQIDLAGSEPLGQPRRDPIRVEGELTDEEDGIDQVGVEDAVQAMALAVLTDPQRTAPIAW
jgi:hypothetical protein